MQLRVPGCVSDPDIHAQPGNVDAQRLERLQVQIAVMPVWIGDLVSVARLLVVVEEVVGVCVDLGTNLQLEADSGPFSLQDHLDIAAVDAAQRSEERRVGKECVRTCRSRWWQSQSTKKSIQQIEKHHK